MPVVSHLISWKKPLFSLKLTCCVTFSGRVVLHPWFTFTGRVPLSVRGSPCKFEGATVIEESEENTVQIESEENTEEIEAEQNRHKIEAEENSLDQIEAEENSLDQIEAEENRLKQIEEEDVAVLAFLGVGDPHNTVSSEGNVVGHGSCEAVFHKEFQNGASFLYDHRCISSGGEFFRDVTRDIIVDGNVHDSCTVDSVMIPDTLGNNGQWEYDAVMPCLHWKSSNHVLRAEAVMWKPGNPLIGDMRNVVNDMARDVEWEPRAVEFCVGTCWKYEVPRLSPKITNLSGSVGNVYFGTIPLFPRFPIPRYFPVLCSITCDVIAIFRSRPMIGLRSSVMFLCKQTAIL